MKQLRVVGMDPSMRNWGIAKATLDLDTLTFMVDRLELIDTEAQDKKVVRKNSDDLRRARLLHTGMCRHLGGDEYTRELPPAIAFVEVPHGSQSARAMASYGICVGVLASCPVPIIEVSATEVKMAALGSKTASKDDMIAWAFERFPNANWLTKKRGGVLSPTADNEHLADACAAIAAGILTEQFRQLRSMWQTTVPA